MARATVTVKSNIDEGVKTAAKLDEELPDSVDAAARKIAESFRRESQRVMQRNGSVVTGTGIRSMKTRGMGVGKAGVFGAAYLDDLDKGTSAHAPDTDNQRFIAAARSYGMSRQQLAQIIARKGTRPHPWIDQSLSKIRKKSSDKTRIELDRAIQKSLK